MGRRKERETWILVKFKLRRKEAKKLLRIRFCQFKINKKNYTLKLNNSPMKIKNRNIGFRGKESIK